MASDDTAGVPAGTGTEGTADAYAGRVLDAALGTVDILAIHLGDRLGWYRALRDHGALTSGELARLTDTDERYAREWLEQQATAGFLVAEDGVHGAFSLPAGAAEALTDDRSLAYVAPLARMLAASAAQMPALLAAYRDGGGVSWDELGDDARWSQADMNRPWFESRLAPALASVPEVDAMLRAPGCHILDVACGAGWSAIALARAYPEASVLGVDIDRPSVDQATTNAADAGLGDRVAFRAGDAGAVLDDDAAFDVAFVFEALHDLPQPVEVLSAIRGALAPGAPLIVMDEAVADALTPGDDTERLMYGFSLLVCLPDAMSTTPTAATGTVMRPATLRAYARDAGFTDVAVLPIEDFALFRFYALTG
ncbi:class I SAM-dependent methyltransferase [Demequina sp. NBRC 110056]|uniref:class I SAM-dependent methyltransferase n=1 Tax=Demequina sp. NBRC 110056 TaxID=1570345 RepID=UPI000A0663A4|nr:class I SAM-dependent methyltransferase [Demequina sp. NBRC 110056]